MNTIKKLKLKSVPPFKYDIYLILDIYYFCSLIRLNFHRYSLDGNKFYI